MNLVFFKDGVAQFVEHWTANLATRPRSPVGKELSDLMYALHHVQIEYTWAGLSVCNCWHACKWCGTIKAVGNTDHTRQIWAQMQTPLSPLAGCGPVGEGTSGKVLNWTVHSLNHLYHHNEFSLFFNPCSGSGEDFSKMALILDQCGYVHGPLMTIYFITPPTSFSRSRHSIDVTWRHTLSPRCTQRQNSVAGIHWNAYYRLNKGWWRDKFVIRPVSDVLRAQSRFVKCVGGSACGLTPHKFY